MQMLRGLAVVACVVLCGAAQVLGMSGVARADWLGDAYAAHARGDYQTEISIIEPKAEQGVPVAQYYMGVTYAIGIGVAQDYVKAHMWYNVAAIDGSSQIAALHRDDIAKKMTPAHIARAQELASQCVAQKFKNCGK